MPKRSIANTNEIEPTGVVRRRYESRVRRARVAETRERILAAASELAHRANRWDWRELTIGAIAKQAGVSERTVYRYFPAERQLHEALMRRLEEEAGVSYEQLSAADLTTLATRLFASLSSFAVPPAFTPRDPTFIASDERRREGIVQAVRELTRTWSDDERRRAAAMIDVLTTPLPYERLVTDWGFDAGDAIVATNWALSVLIKAMRNGSRPSARRRSQSPLKR